VLPPFGQRAPRRALTLYRLLPRPRPLLRTRPPVFQFLTKGNARIDSTLSPITGTPISDCGFSSFHGQNSTAFPQGGPSKLLIVSTTPTLPRFTVELSRALRTRPAPRLMACSPEPGASYMHTADQRQLHRPPRREIEEQDPAAPFDRARMGDHAVAARPPANHRLSPMSRP